MVLKFNGLKIIIQRPLEHVTRRCSAWEIIVMIRIYSTNWQLSWPNPQIKQVGSRYSYLHKNNSSLAKVYTHTIIVTITVFLYLLWATLLAVQAKRERIMIGCVFLRILGRTAFWITSKHPLLWSQTNLHLQSIKPNSKGTTNKKRAAAKK